MWERLLEEVKDLISQPKKWDVEITWDLTMRCNYSCRYCESYNNDIPHNLKDLETYKNSIKYLKKFFGNKKTRIEFLGGEPTLFKDWAKLLEFCEQEGFIYEITTNLSMKMKTLKNKLKDKNISKCINVSWHPSFVPDEEKMIGKINFLYEKGILSGVSILADTEYWDKVLSALKKLEHLKSLITVSQIYDEGSGMLSITKDPWKMSEEQKEVMHSYNQSSESSFNTLINGVSFARGKKYLEENNLLNFKGMYCAIGQKRITILPNGNVYPSACLTNYPKACIGNIYRQDILKVKKPIKCPFNICRCGPDVRIEKHRNIEDFL